MPTPVVSANKMTNFKIESENPNVSAGKDFGIDEHRISRLRAHLSAEEMLHALIKNPEWLASLAKTSADLLSYQELLNQWQAAGYPDLKAWQAEENPVPLPTTFGQAISISQNS
jgi:hypothetical protein